MSTIVLFHSALGLRPAVRRFADALRADGHQVVTPDLFDGEVFDRLEDGIARRDAIGIPALMGRAAQAVAALPGEIVYAGFSMGAASAQWLAATRPGCRGAVLMHAALPLQALGVERWPDVDVEVHVTAGDPWVDRAQLDAMASASGRFTIHTYPGSAHLFTDDDGEEFDAESAALVLARVRTFLAGR